MADLPHKTTKVVTRHEWVIGDENSAYSFAHTLRSGLLYVERDLAQMGVKLSDDAYKWRGGDGGSLIIWVEVPTDLEAKPTQVPGANEYARLYNQKNEPVRLGSQFRRTANGVLYTVVAVNRQHPRRGSRSPSDYVLLKTSREHFCWVRGHELERWFRVS